MRKDGEKKENDEVSYGLPSDYKFPEKMHPDSNHVEQSHSQNLTNSDNTYPRENFSSLDKIGYLLVFIMKNANAVSNYKFEMDGFGRIGAKKLNKLIEFNHKPAFELFSVVCEMHKELKNIIANPAIGDAVKNDLIKYEEGIIYSLIKIIDENVRDISEEGKRSLTLQDLNKEKEASVRIGNKEMLPMKNMLKKMIKDIEVADRERQDLSNKPKSPEKRNGHHEEREGSKKRRI